jgi:hypothetical protein
MTAFWNPTGRPAGPGPQRGHPGDRGNGPVRGRQLARTAPDLHDERPGNHAELSAITERPAHVVTNRPAHRGLHHPRPTRRGRHAAHGLLQSELRRRHNGTPAPPNSRSLPISLPPRRLRACRPCSARRFILARRRTTRKPPPGPDRRSGATHLDLVLRSCPSAQPRARTSPLLGGGPSGSRSCARMSPAHPVASTD